jgi:hypothetical protein
VNRIENAVLRSPGIDSIEIAGLTFIFEKGAELAVWRVCLNNDGIPTWNSRSSIYFSIRPATILGAVNSPKSRIVWNT